MTGATERDKLEGLLKGKTIAAAELARGTVRLVFTDGTRFEREKTFEGMIVATLYSVDGETIATSRI